MTKRPKEAYGKKLIYHYSAPVIFTLLFSLIALTAFALALYFPYMSVGEVGLTGLDIVLYPVSLFYQGETGNFFGELVINSINHTSSMMDFMINETFEGLAFLNPIIQILFFIMSIELYIMAIFAIILLIGSLVMIFSGRLKSWKLPYACIKAFFYFGLFFYFTTVIALNIYSALIKQSLYYDGLYSYIFFGVFFIASLVTGIIYRKAFRDHVYVKNERTLNQYIEEYEKEHVVVDTSSPEDVIIEQAPRVEMVPLEDQTEKNDTSGKRLPRGLKHIGGHAFSQNTALEEADIPLGIEVLGAGAFANCVNLRVVHIPESVKKIEYNCFFNCIRLQRITYGGSREMWKRVKRGSNWLTAAGTRFVVCRDGAIAVNPEN